ncbi:hypothetical protein CLOM_g11882, partial [Closterium sp. NIES-68]
LVGKCRVEGRGARPHRFSSLVVRYGAARLNSSTRQNGRWEGSPPRTTNQRRPLRGIQGQWRKSATVTVPPRAVHHGPTNEISPPI